MAALGAAGAERLAGKVVIDVANPLDFSVGMPPRLLICNDDSLGEQIQDAFPAARVVKALNTVSHLVMVDPGRIEGAHTSFLCGNDDSAKSETRGILEKLWLGAGLDPRSGRHQRLPRHRDVPGTLASTKRRPGERRLQYLGSALSRAADDLALDLALADQIAARPAAVGELKAGLGKRETAPPIEPGAGQSARTILSRVALKEISEPCPPTIVGIFTLMLGPYFPAAFLITAVVTNVVGAGTSA